MFFGKSLLSFQQIKDLQVSREDIFAGGNANAQVRILRETLMKGLSIDQDRVFSHPRDTARSSEGDVRRIPHRRAKVENKIGLSGNGQRAQGGFHPWNFVKCAQSVLRHEIDNAAITLGKKWQQAAKTRTIVSSRIGDQTSLRALCRKKSG